MMQPLQETSLSESSSSSIAESVSNPIEQWITHADRILSALEKDQVLGPTIRRLASDLATVIGSLAREWEDADDTKKRLWAKSCLEEAKNQLELQDDSSTINYADSNIASLSEDELIQQVSIAKSLLLDIEESLKSISVDEADEIADVALVVLRIFLQTLKTFHVSLLNGGDDDDDDRNNSSNYYKKTSKHTNTVQIEILEEIIHSPDHIGTISNKETIHILDSSSPKKTRLIWPPLGPTLTQTAIWGQDMAIKKPLISIALAMTLWPTAIVVGFVGATDYVIQSTYNQLQGHPFVEQLEVGAHNLFDVAKLYFLCSKLVIKQGIRIGKRQVQRRGGIKKTLQDIGGWTLDRVLHPVDTIAQGTHAVVHGFGVIQGVIQKKNPKRNTGVLESNVHYRDCT